MPCSTASSCCFQLFPEGKDPHPAHTPDEIDKNFREWVEKGKPEDQFDHTAMGLDMLTIPTRHFGWEGITETMKKVTLAFSNLCFEINNSILNCNSELIQNKN